MALHLLPMLAGFALSQLVVFLKARLKLRSERSRRWLAILLLCANLPWPLVVYVLSTGRTLPTLATAIVVRPFLTWQFGCLLVVLIGLIVAAVRWLVRLALRFRARAEPAPSPPTPSLTRRVVLRSAVAGGAAAVLVPLGRSLADPQVTRLPIPIPDLPRALHGLRILHLSDLHVGFWMSAQEAGRVFELARSLHPDLAVITGDLVDMNPAFTLPLATFINAAKPPLGWHVIMGNHDFYAGADAITGILRDASISVLRDDHVDFGPRGLPLLLVGTDDPGGGWSGAGGPTGWRRALAGAPEERTRILLAHRPTAFDEVLGKGFALTLAGHTHGSQMALPFGLPGIASLTYKRPRGHYVEQAQHLYVSRGIGSVGLPFRINSPPEIALLELVPGAAA